MSGKSDYVRTNRSDRRNELVETKLFLSKWLTSGAAEFAKKLCKDAGRLKLSAQVNILYSRAFPLVLQILWAGYLLDGGVAFSQNTASSAPKTTTVDTSAIDEAICWLMYFQNGSYGALLLAVSGIGAVVGAAMGSYRAAMNCLVVGVGSWLIQPVAELMFNYWPRDCGTLMSRVPVGMAGGSN